MIRILTLNFETSCTNIPFHNEHGNVISAKRSFIEISYGCFLFKNQHSNT